MKDLNSENKEKKIYQTVPFAFILIFYAITIIHNIISFMILKVSISNIGFYGTGILVLVIVLKYIIYLVAFISALICLLSRKGKNKKFTVITILLLALWVPIAISGIAPFNQTTKQLTQDSSTKNVKNSTSTKSDNKISTAETKLTPGKRLGEQEYEDKVKQSKTELAPNKLIKIRFGSTLDDIKKVEGNNEIKPMYGLYKQQNSEKLAKGSQVDSYDITAKEDDWYVDRSYSMDGDGKVKGIASYYHHDKMMQVQGVYKKYLDLKKQFSEIYGEPSYIGGGEKQFFNNVPKNNDENKFDDQIGNGDLKLESYFVAKDTKIDLYVTGSKNPNQTQYARNIGSVIVSINPLEKKK